MSSQAEPSTNKDELLDEANDKVSLGLMKLTRDTDPVIQNVLTHIQIFNQSVSNSPETTISQAMANLDGSQIKIINKAAGMNNHPNTVKTLAKAFFEALDNPALLYNCCTSTKPSRIML